jgi:hypothetical protein
MFSITKVDPTYGTLEDFHKILLGSGHRTLCAVWSLLILLIQMSFRVPKIKDNPYQDSHMERPNPTIEDLFCGGSAAVDNDEQLLQWWRKMAGPQCRGTR